MRSEHIIICKPKCKTCRTWDLVRENGKVYRKCKCCGDKTEFKLTCGD